MVLGVVFASSRKLLRVVLYANFYLSYFDPLLDPVFFLRSFSLLSTWRGPDRVRGPLRGPLHILRLLFDAGSHEAIFFACTGSQ